MVHSPPSAKSCSLQPVAHGRERSQVEARRHLRPIPAGADHGRVRFVAQGQAQGVDEDGFAGAGLAGEGRHARAQFEF